MKGMAGSVAAELESAVLNEASNNGTSLLKPVT
jgi:hypothetical protein